MPDNKSWQLILAEFDVFRENVSVQSITKHNKENCICIKTVRPKISL